MAAKPGFFDYVTAAFNARPFGMFVAPNWVGLAAFGLLGVVNPGFWVLGAGLELGYLLAARDQRALPAPGRRRSARRPPRPTGTQRIQTLLGRARRRPTAGSTSSIAERCRSIIDLQLQRDDLDARRARSAGRQPRRLSWMYLRLLVARRTIEHVIGDTGDGSDIRAS